MRLLPSRVISCLELRQQRVCNLVHLCDGVFDDPVPFLAGLEADGNVYKPGIFIELRIIEEFAIV